MQDPEETGRKRYEESPYIKYNFCNKVQMFTYERRYVCHMQCMYLFCFRLLFFWSF